ncbi:hypothetical protein N9Y42_08930 [Mariniblastus sp.]|nr:hypothetical protein [Mariniblastus sp.]
MPYYLCEFLDPQGQQIRDLISASSEAAAKTCLLELGCVPTDVSVYKLPLYKFEAIDEAGHPFEDVVVASSEEEALIEIRARGYGPINISVCNT